MTVAMLSIPIVDGLAKYLSAAYSPLYISWARYAVASAVVLPLGVGLHGARFLPSERRAPHFWRTVFLITAMTLYFLSIARIPLATAASTFFVGPIIAVVLSVLVLKERMTTRKLVSLGLGVAGSMVMLRPGRSTDPGVLMALGAGVSFAAYLIATRQASQTADPLKTLAFQCAVGTVLLTPQALVTWEVPASADLIFFAGLGAFSAGSGAGEGGRAGHLAERQVAPSSSPAGCSWCGAQARIATVGARSASLPARPEGWCLARARHVPGTVRPVRPPSRFS